MNSKPIVEVFAFWQLDNLKKKELLKNVLGVIKINWGVTVRKLIPEFSEAWACL